MIAFDLKLMMYRHGIALLLALILLPGAAGTASGQAWPGLTDTQEITVTVLTRDDFHALGARTLADLLVMVPGVFDHEGRFHKSRGETHLTARSRPMREVLIVLDGIPLQDPYTGTTDLADLPLANIDRVEIVRSPSSTLIGPGGQAMVVRMWTTPIKLGYDVGLDAHYGLPNELDTAVEAGMGDRGYGARAAYQNSISDGYKVPESFERMPRENGNIRERSYRWRDLAWARLGYSHDWDWAVDASGGYTYGSRGSPVAVNDPDPIWQSVQDHARWHVRSGGWLNGDFFSLAGNLAVLHERQRLPQYTGPDSGTKSDNERYGFTRSGAYLTPSVNFGRYSLIQARASFWVDDSYIVDYRARDIRLITARQGYALEDVIRPTDDLLCIAGIGVETQQAFFSEVLELPDMSVMPRGRVMLHWQVWNDVGVMLSASHNHRAPTQKQLLDPSQGNIGLKSERFDRIEAGMDFGHDMRIRARFRTYLLSGRDIISTKGESGRFHNDISSQATGIEMEVGSVPLTGLSLSGWVNWTVSTERPAGLPGRTVPYAPELTAAFAIGYIAPFGLGANIDGRYASEFSDSPLPGTRSDQQDLLLPQRFVADARIFYRYRDFIEIYIESTNLTDSYYETSRGFPEPGREYGIGIRIGSW